MPGLVDSSEIIAALLAEPEGMTVGTLLRGFGTRVGDDAGQMPRKEWIQLVKEIAFIGPDKKLRVKPGRPADGS